MESDQFVPLLADVKAKLDDTFFKLKEVSEELDQVKNVNQLLNEISEFQTKSLDILNKM
jgi:hypothetical protein